MTKSLRDEYWLFPRLPVDEKTIKDLSLQIVPLNSTHAEVPISPQSSSIQRAIDERFPQSQVNQFLPNTFERGCLANAVLILCQIDGSERELALQKSLTLVTSNDQLVQGVIFSSPENLAIEPSSSQRGFFEVRLRCSDLSLLRMATSKFVSALHPGRRRTQRTFSSQGASVTRRGRSSIAFDTAIQKVEIRSVANEAVDVGEVVPVKNQLDLIVKAIELGSSRILFYLSLLLVGASAALYWWFPDAGWWNWTDQLIGRLATGAFGALLVDGSMEYSALRESASSGHGPVLAGAVVRWGQRKVKQLGAN